MRKLRTQQTNAQTTKAMLCTAVAIVVFLLAVPRPARAQTVATIYTFANNSRTSLTADPHPRNASCYGAVSGQAYIAGGLNNNNPQTASTVNEFSASANKWTTQAAMPVAALWHASAVGNGVLYCIGGQSSFQGPVVANVQIYQP